MLEQSREVEHFLSKAVERLGDPALEIAQSLIRRCHVLIIRRQICMSAFAPYYRRDQLTIYPILAPTDQALHTRQALLEPLKLLAHFHESRVRLPDFAERVDKGVGERVHHGEVRVGWRVRDVVVLGDGLGISSGPEMQIRGHTHSVLVRKSLTSLLRCRVGCRAILSANLCKLIVSFALRISSDRNSLLHTPLLNKVGREAVSLDILCEVSVDTS